MVKSSFSLGISALRCPYVWDPYVRDRHRSGAQEQAGVPSSHYLTFFFSSRPPWDLRSLTEASDQLSNRFLIFLNQMLI